MIREITQIIKANCGKLQGSRVVAGVSGGADSVCLLLCLHEISETLGFDLRAVHVNHGIRGAEADRDAEFTRKLCEKLSVPCRVVSVDVPGKAEKEGISLEEAGRRARYEVLFSEAGEGFVAVAHNKEDQQETILLNILRGTGLAGAAGMEVCSGRIIRPLLFTSRREIEAFLKSRNQNFCVDSTNLTTDYTRNKIRLQLMPLLSTINEGAGEHLEALASDCKKASDLIDKRVEKLFESCKVSAGEVIIPDMVKTEEDIVLSRLIHRAITICGGKARDISRVHVEEVKSLLFGRTGACVSLPYGQGAVRRYKEVVIYQVKEKTGSAERVREHLEALNNELSGAEKIKNEKDIIIPEKAYTKWFDYDKINTSLCWRTRQEGDRIELGGAGVKSLNRYMIDVKIPGDLRDSIPVLADGKEVLWVAGYRISERYKVTPETKNIIIISYKEIRNGRTS